MSCTAQRPSNRGRAYHAEAHPYTARRLVLCFECYRSMVDRPERVRLMASPFPRVLTAREFEHRGRMLAHLEDSRAHATVSGDRTDKEAQHSRSATVAAVQ